MVKNYKDGAEGMIQWCEDFVYVPIYPIGSDMSVWVSLGDLPDTKNPDTGKSYRDMWENQKIILREGLRMRNGRFVYRLIVFCWMRGEGKSLLVCLIQMWKFFCWPRQMIVLGANSKDQVKFVHFDMIRDIILNSPRLIRIVGRKNVQEKEIRIKDKTGNIRSMIRAISSFSGIVSNITGYTFSEFFDQKNPRFYTQLDGSIRNMPNALGTIDSTVSKKDHPLYKLFEGYTKKELKEVYFSHRESLTGDVEDYWNPNMTKDQLDDYRVKFPFGEFERYFMNTWDSSRGFSFGEDVVQRTKIIGTAHGGLMNDHQICMTIEETKQQIRTELGVSAIGLEITTDDCIRRHPEKFRFVNEIYGLPIISPTLSHGFEGLPVHTLNELGDMLDTNWAILAGADMADPMAQKQHARSIFTMVAKGLVGSRSMRLAYSDPALIPYVYFVICITVLGKDNISAIKELLEWGGEQYGGVDVLCGERYGLWDMEKWCVDRGIIFEPVFPNYGRQFDCFSEFFRVITHGRLKAPTIDLPGAVDADILREELMKFDHDPVRKWFGSSEKFREGGVQDDTIYSLGWTIYGGRDITSEKFLPRGPRQWWGMMVPNRDLIGDYAR